MKYCISVKQYIEMLMAFGSPGDFDERARLFMHNNYHQLTLSRYECFDITPRANRVPSIYNIVPVNMLAERQWKRIL